MLHDQNKLKEYIAGNKIFCPHATSCAIDVVSAQRLFSHFLKEKYLLNEIVKVVFETTGISRVQVPIAEGSNEMIYVWYLEETYPFTHATTE